MHTNELAALGTRPFFIFFPNKTPDTDLAYSIQILNRAHLVLCPVALVHVRDALAGKVVTTEAILEAAGQKFFTSLDFADDAGFRFKVIVSTAAWT
jgi:hypothetical protein